MANHKTDEREGKKIKKKDGIRKICESMTYISHITLYYAHDFIGTHSHKQENKIPIVTYYRISDSPRPKKPMLEQGYMVYDNGRVSLFRCFGLTLRRLSLFPFHEYANAGLSKRWSTWPLMRIC